MGKTTINGYRLLEKKVPINRRLFFKSQTVAASKDKCDMSKGAKKRLAYNQDEGTCLSDVFFTFAHSII